MIFHFSGTGNSEYVAKRIAERVDDEAVSINEAMKAGTPTVFTSEKPYVFVTPTYAWRMPRVVTDWIDACEFKGSRDVYVILTCGTNTGNAVGYAQRFFEKHGWNFKGFAPIVMPENYVAMFKVPSHGEALEIVKKALPVIDDLGDRIAEGRPFEPFKGKHRFLSGAVNRFFYRFIISAKGFYTNKRCNGCAKCVAMCPMNNITMVDDRPVWGDRCTHCMACIAGCQREAIEYKKKLKKHRRYHMRYLIFDLKNL